MKNIDLATKDEWRKATQDDPNATFFNTPLWYKIWKNSYGKDYVCLKIQHNEDTFFFPTLTYFHWMGFKFAKGSPAYTYNHIISASGKNINISEIFNYFDGVYFLENPLSPINEEITILQSQTIPTHLIQLDKLNENISSGWRTMTKKNLDRAQSEHLQVEKANTLNDWLAFYKVYKELSKTWDQKLSVQPERIFRNLAKAESNKINLFIAYYQNEIVGGLILFTHNNHAVNWLNASLPEKKDLHPTTLLHYIAIQYAKDEGFKYYDFNPSGGEEQVDFYKSGFKPLEKKILKVINYKSLRYKVWENATTKVAKVIKRKP